MLQAAEEDSVEYIPWDFKYFAKLRGNQILEDMQPVIRKALNEMGMFVCPPSSPCPEANRNTVSSWVRHPPFAPLRYMENGPLHWLWWPVQGVWLLSTRRSLWPFCGRAKTLPVSEWSSRRRPGASYTCRNAADQGPHVLRIAW